MAITLQQFIERLTASGLMTAAEFSAFHDGLPPDQRTGDVKALVAALFRAGKITKYQAQAVYDGKTKGLVFGEYVVLDKLGEGGMGIVLKAQHRRMKRVVAIKVLSAAGMKSPGAVERFHREVEAAAKLEHPNIVTAYDAGEHQGMHYLAMQFVDGKDLAAIVKDRGPMAVHAAIECTLQAARGLGYAHGKGIVHRDIKPSNLLMDKDGTVKILDMGLARIGGLVDDSGQDRLTVSGQVMGTCDYMAPEQALDSHAVDARADIYALGCTFYRLLAGQPPYRGETLMQILMAHQQAPIPSLCQARPDVPAEVDGVFQRMVAKQPEERYQSTAEVVAELETVLAALSGRSAPPVAARAESSSMALAKSLAFLQEDRNVSGTLRVPLAPPAVPPAKPGTRRVPATLGPGQRRFPGRPAGGPRHTACAGYINGRQPPKKAARPHRARRWPGAPAGDRPHAGPPPRHAGDRDRRATGQGRASGRQPGRRESSSGGCQVGLDAQPRRGQVRPCRPGRRRSVPTRPAHDHGHAGWPGKGQGHAQTGPAGRLALRCPSRPESTRSVGPNSWACRSRSPTRSEQSLVSAYSVSWLLAHPRQFVRRLLWATILAAA